MVSFDNTEIAFKSKSSKDLNRAYWLFKIVSSGSAVRFGKWSTDVALKFGLPIEGMIRKTIFRQFCGGESIQDSLKTAHELGDYGVNTILDYSVEGKTKEDDFDRTVNEIIATIHEASTNPNIPFAVFKVTGICLFRVLEAANEGTDHLDTETKEKYDKLIERVTSICSEAHAHSIPVFIDAEETWIQGTIDRIVRLMSMQFNRERAIVYNTIQMYRHDRLAFLKEEIIHAEENRYYLGMKIVRGAYMEKERERAEKMGYPSPIQVDKKSCDADFNAAVRLSLDHIDRVSICAGTHNEESAQLLAEMLVERSIPKDDSRVFFAQLLGMSDHISYNLAHAGYNVAKYVPYGPIKEVLPYLIRRAEENTSVAGQTTRELSLIMKERKRRKTTSK